MPAFSAAIMPELSEPSFASAASLTPAHQKRHHYPYHYQWAAHRAGQPVYVIAEMSANHGQDYAQARASCRRRKPVARTP